MFRGGVIKQHIEPKSPTLVDSGRIVEGGMDNEIDSCEFLTFKSQLYRERFCTKVFQYEIFFSKVEGNCEMTSNECGKNWSYAKNKLKK